MSEHERREELRRFLKDRRARIRPGDVGLPTTSRRRVRGLRREEVAALAGIGVSWYTALENGDADGVSESTLFAIVGALRLSESERQYLVALAERLRTAEHPQTPDPLVVVTMRAIVFPGYIITATWDIVDCNEAFRRVWGVGENEIPYNAIDRLFLEPAARKMHGEHFSAHIEPIVAMLHSGLGRRPYLKALQQLRDRLIADNETRKMWNEYEISDPFLPTRCKIESSIGTFSYETLNLPIPGALYAIVVQVPDSVSLQRLTRASSGFDAGQ